MSYEMPNPFDENAAPVVRAPHNSGEREPSVMPAYAGAAASNVDLRRLWSEMQVMSDWAAAQILGEEGLQRMEFETWPN